MIDDTVLSEKVGISDIETLLSEASLSWLHPHEAYRLGYADGQRQIFNSALSNLMPVMVPAAEIFYQLLQKFVPKEDILQHRIGLDSTTDAPVTLAVVAQKHDDKMMDIMSMERSLELYLLNERKLECGFWTITDESLDQPLLEQDFPYKKDI